MNNSKLTAITIIPIITPMIVILLFSYSCAIGISSSKEINTIIPATAEKSNPKIVSLKNGRKTRYPTIAPIGSVIPDKNDIKKAFFLLPVEK